MNGCTPENPQSACTGIFYWLFREPFPVRQLGNQIVLVMLDAVAVNTVTAVVIGLIMA